MSPRPPAGWPFPRRARLAAELRARRADVARAARDAGRAAPRTRRGTAVPVPPVPEVEDARSHLDFLAGAIEAGAREAFADYARWAARVLASRGRDPRRLREGLEGLASVLRRGLSPAASELVADYTRAGVAACAETPQAPLASEGDGALDLARRLFVRAVLGGRRQAALTVAQDALRTAPLDDVYVEVFQEALYEVGRRWEAGRVTVAEEHMATAVTQYVLARVFPGRVRAARRRWRVVITGVEGELHQVGAHMVADVLEADGWDVRFLGGNLPMPGILRVIEEYEPHVLGVSTTMLFNLPQVAALIEATRARRGGGAPRVALGGAAFRYAPHVPRELGADGFAPDLRGARALVREWASAPP